MRSRGGDLAAFRLAIDIDPNWAWGYIKLARTLAIQKKYKEALEQAEIAERRIAGGAEPISWSCLAQPTRSAGKRCAPAPQVSSTGKSPMRG